MKVIIELERLGYSFTLNEDIIHYVYKGDNPDPTLVRPLLLALQEEKIKALCFLRKRNGQRSIVLDKPLSIEEAPEFLRVNGLRAIDIDWPEGELPRLIVASVN